MSGRNYCRICLESGPPLSNIWDTDENLRLDKIVMLVAQIAITKNDQGSHKICKNCKVLARYASKFRDLCLTSDKHFKTLKTRNLDDELEPDDLKEENFSDYSDNDLFDPLNESSPSPPSREKLVKSPLWTPPTPATQTKKSVFEEINCSALKVENEAQKSQATVTTVDFSEQFDEDYKEGFARICEITLGELNDLCERYSLEEMKKKYKCEVCFKIFLAPSKLLRHEKQIHDKSNAKDNKDPFKCEICHKGLTSEAKLYSHKISNHPEYMCEKVSPSSVYHCVICLKIFEKRRDLFRHVGVHDERFKKLESAQSFEVKCLKCASVFVDVENRNIHACDKPKSLKLAKLNESGENSGEFRCDQCGSCFQVEASLERHRHICDLLKKSLIHRQDGHTYRCSICPEKFLSIHTFYDHLNVHEKQAEGNSEESECSLCLKKFPGIKHLSRHCKLHEENAGYCCIECKELYPLTKDFRSHLFFHAMAHNKDIVTQEYACELCPHKYSRKDKLKQHIIRRHGANAASDVPTADKKERKMYPAAKRRERACEICSKVFRDSSCVKKHIERRHLKLKPYLCDICARNFSDRRSLIYHMSSHIGKVLQCPECPRKFSNEGALKKHNDHVHDTSKHKYVCEVCGSKYIQPYLLKNHMKSAHNPTAKEKNHVCKTCDKKFVSDQALKNHVKVVHSLKKPFDCGTCGRTFHVLNKLQRHRRQVHKENPHHCEHCPMTFEKFHELWDHWKLHFDISGGSSFAS